MRKMIIVIMVRVIVVKSLHFYYNTHEVISQLTATFSYYKQHIGIISKQREEIILIYCVPNYTGSAILFIY